jgi:general secretion pathway protein G
MILRKRTDEFKSTLARAAFTLMEMLVVVAIIVALAGLGGYYVMGQLQTAQNKAAKVKAEVIAKAIETYQLDHNTPPQGLPSLLQSQQDSQGNTLGPYLKTQNDLTDPWGKEYQFEMTNVNGAQVPRVHTTSPKGITISNLGQ